MAKSKPKPKSKSKSFEESFADPTYDDERQSAESFSRKPPQTETRPEMLYTGTSSPQDRARDLVRSYYDGLADDDVYVVWFAKVLQNWKVLVSTNVQDDLYYEVSYNGVKKETYVDAYRKVSNVVVPD